MIIQKIEIENFFCYYGKNVFEFSVGPTIIIGQNLTGKSKLFDAFNWVTFDRAFDTSEEKWFNTKNWKDNLVNSYSKNLCKINKELETAVTFWFTDEKGTKYLLNRQYSIRRSSNDSWDCDEKSELVLSITNPDTKNTDDLYDKDAQDKVNVLFTKNLSKYFFFQGESISQIMSLGQRSAFSNALTGLSKIEVFKKAESYSKKVKQIYNDEFVKKEEQNLESQVKKEGLEQELTDIQNKIDGLDVDNQNLTLERDQAKKVLDDRETELEKFEECRTIISNLKGYTNDLISINQKRKDFLESKKREVLENWIYAGTKEMFAGFLDIFAENKKAKNIPERIRQQFVKEMLDEEVCKICVREAKKGTNAYKNIQGFINKKSLGKEIEDIHALVHVAETTTSVLKELPGNLEGYYEEHKLIEKEITDAKDGKQSMILQLTEVLPDGVTEDEVLKKDFTSLMSTYNKAKKDHENYKLRIKQKEGRILELKERRETKEKQYNELVTKSENVVERDRFQLADAIFKVGQSLHKSFLDDLIKEIQKRADEYFQDMTKRNKALSGNVMIDYNEKEIYTVNSQGKKMSSINQANKVSLQISFIASILSVSNEFWGEYYPFITDAPISALGGDNKISAIETMINIFRQSIIILKDDVSSDDPESVRQDQVRKLIQSNSKIKNAYELFMVGDTEIEQHTKIVDLKSA